VRKGLDTINHFAFALWIAIKADQKSKKAIDMTDHHNRLMVKPNLSGKYATLASDYSFSVSNTGNGPAIIKSQKVSLDGVCHETEGSHDGGLIHFVNTAIGPNTCEIFRLGPGYGVLPGKEIAIIKLTESHFTDEYMKNFEDAMRRTKIEIEYGSMYEDEVFKPLIWPTQPPSDPAQGH